MKIAIVLLKYKVNVFLKLQKLSLKMYNLYNSVNDPYNENIYSVFTMLKLLKNRTVDKK